MTRKMKDSGIEWIGMIPEGWGIHPVIYAFSEIRKKNTDGSITNALKFLNGTIVQKTNFDAECDDYVAETILNYTVVKPNSIMINGLNLNYDLKSLRVGMVNQIGVITSAYLALWPDNSKIFPDYANYLFKGYETKMAFHNMGAGIRLTLGFKEFKKQPVLFPPLPEQHRIAAYLDATCAQIDAVIEKTRASIEEYKKLKQAVITQAVTKGIRPGRRMKDSGIEWIGEIPDGWEYRKLKTFIEIPVIDGPHESPDLFDSGVPYISATAIENGRIDFDLMRGYVSEEYCIECDKRYKPRRDDILLVKLGASTGQVAIVDTDLKFNIWVPLAAIRCSDSAYSKFIYYGFQSEYLIRQMELSWTFGTQQTLGVKTIEQLKFILPAYNEQKQIAAYLDTKCAEIDTLIAKKQQLLAELESYKKSLIFEYVTGKKEVLG